MAASITLFANLTAPTGPELDGNFTAFAVFGNIPCTVSGTNALTLVQNANTPTLTQLTSYIRFTGTFAATNNGAMTVQIGSFGVLPAYTDGPSGPTAFVGGECIIGNMFSAIYDPALNSGNGGYHIGTGTQLAGGTIAGNLTLASGNLTLSSGNLTLSSGVLSVLGGSLGASLSSTLLTGNSLTVSALLLTGNSLTVSALLSNYSLSSIGVGTLSSVQFGNLGSTLATLTRMVSALSTVVFSVTPANLTQDQNIVVAGAQVRDAIILGIGSSVPAGAGFTGFCGTLGTVTVRLLNPTASSISLTSMTVRAVCMGVTP